METEMEKLKIKENINKENLENDDVLGQASEGDQTSGDEKVHISKTQDDENNQVSESSHNVLTDTNKMSKSDKNSSGSESNKMREIEIEKIVLHCGGIEDKLDKSIRLLEKITKSKKTCIIQSKKRYPAFGISPGKKSGCKITIRNKEKIKDLLTRFFSSFDNEISKKQITENQVCFGIHEYIEVPGLEYERDLGILGFEVMIIFARKGKRVKFRKIKRGKYPKKQEVSKEEIIKYLIKNFGLEITAK